MEIQLPLFNQAFLVIHGCAVGLRKHGRIVKRHKSTKQVYYALNEAQNEQTPLSLLFLLP